MAEALLANLFRWEVKGHDQVRFWGGVSDESSYE